MKNFNNDQVTRVKASWELQEHVLAPQIKLFEKLDSIEEGDLVLLSLSEEVGSTTRYKWYGFCQITSTPIVDCGNYIGNDIEPLITLIEKVWEKGACIMLISSNLDQGLYHTIHDKLGNRISISANVSRFPDDTCRLYPDISFVSMANQVHRSKPVHLLKSNNLMTLRLGQMRSYFAECEPYIRHADCCFFNLDSVRFSDAPAQPNPSTSGLTSEEACHIARYAGQASRMKLFWLYNFEPEHDTRQVTADLAAQMMWYFADGIEERKDPMPVDVSRLQAYIVEFDKLDIPLTFYKSPVTDRWWVSGSIDLDTKPIPCSIRDYESARKGELSQRLLELLHVYS